MVQAQSSTHTLAGFTVTYDFPANATLNLPDAQPPQIMATLRLDAEDKISGANLQIADSSVVEYSYGDFTLFIRNAAYNADEDVLLCSGFFELPESFMEDSVNVRLNFNNLKLNATKVLDLGEVHTNIPISYHGYYYGIGKNSRFYKDSLVLEGYSLLPHNIAQIHSRLTIQANDLVQLKMDSITDEYLHAFGYDFEVVDGNYQNGIWTIESDLILPNEMGRVRANSLKIDTSGVLQEPTFSVDTSTVNMGIYKAVLSKAWLKDNALYVNADLDILGENVHFDSLIISNSGNLVGNNTGVESSFMLSGFQLDSASLVFGKYLIDSLANQKYGFKLDGKVKLPNNWGYVSITDARIYLDGTFYGGRLNGIHSTSLNGLNFMPDEGKFYPKLECYQLTGSIESHADTSVVQIFIDDDLEGYAPMFKGKWSYTGVRFPDLLTSDVKVINIIDTDGDGEYNPLKDAIFDISDSLKIVSKSGSLGHFKGSSNLPNGSLIDIEFNDNSLGMAVVWDHHWELFDFDLPNPGSGKLKVVGSKKSEGYSFKGNSLAGQKLVNIEYRGKSLAKVPVKEDNTFESPVFELINYDPTELRAIAFSDSDQDGVINLNNDQSNDITANTITLNEEGTIYQVFGKSSQNNGSIVYVSLNGSTIGMAMVWDGKWKATYKQNLSSSPNFTAEVYPTIKKDSLLEDVSAHLKYQTLVLDEVDFTEWTEYHSFNVDADPQKNASVLMEGELSFPGIGDIPIDDLDISSTGIRSPGKKDSHGSRNFKFDGYSFTLNSYDLDFSIPQIELDGEIRLPDNAGNMWAKLEGDLNGIQLKSLEAEQKEINIGLFDFHIDSLYLNTNAEIVLEGELDVPNLDKYLVLDQLVVSAGGDRKVANIEAENLELKLNNYDFQVSDAVFISDTLASGAFTDTLRLNGTIDLEELGNINAQNVYLNYKGEIISGDFSVGSKGLKVGGFDLSSNVDSIGFLNNELHILSIQHSVSGQANEITFKHIKIDNQLNFLVDEVLLNQVDLNYRGHSFIADQIKWENDTIRLNGLLNLGNDLGNVELDEVSLLPDGTLAGGIFKPRVTELSYHGFVLEVDSILWDEQQQLVTMNGKIDLPDSLGRINLTGLKVSPQKVEDYGDISFGSQTIEWKNFNLLVDTVVFQEPYFLLEGSFDVNGLGTLKLNNLKLDAGGVFSGGDLLVPNTLQPTYNGFPLQIDSLFIEEDAIELDGLISLGDSLGKIMVTSMELNPDGSFEGGHFLHEGEALEFQNLLLDVNSVDFEGSDLKIHGALELPNTVGRIGVKMSLSYGQSITLDSIFVRNTSINYSDFIISLSDCQFNNGNFIFDGAIQIDGVGSFDVSQLSLSTEGVFQGGNVSYPNSSWQWGVLTAQINSVSIQNHNILMDAQVSLPQNMGTLAITNMAMDSKGDIISADLNIGSFNYSAYTLNVDSAKLVGGNQIKLNGSFMLPNNYGEIDFTDFTIGTDGSILGGVSVYKGDGLSIGQFSASVDQILLHSYQWKPSVSTFHWR
jgi:hypothetical protein